MARIFKNRPLWIAVFLLAVLAGVIAYRVIQASAPREAVPTVEQIRDERGIPVTVARVDRGPLEVWREYSGNVAGAREAVVRARSVDQISEVLVSVGQSVRQGQVLVRVAGEVAAARARQAEAARRQAERTVERLRPLQEAGAISAQEWEAALTQLELAEADLAAAGDALALTSPMNGIVTDVPARPGMIPEAGDPLVRVSDLSRYVVSMRVSASQAAEIRQDQPARAAGTSVTGRVRRIALQADPATRLVEVEIEFPRAASLILGTLATVEIRVAAREMTTLIPRAAVREGTVWIVDMDDRVTQRRLQVGLQAQDRIEVTSGLEAGDLVVVEGGSLLSEGARVRVVSERDVSTAGH